MAEVEEPQFTSLQERIAALNQSQTKQHQTFGKRPPPPIPTAKDRPAAPTRVQTTNNPPIPKFGSSVTNPGAEMPIGVKRPILPPPPVDRDNPRPAAPPSPNPQRKLPPPLPGRTNSETSPGLSPALPSRNGPNQLGRKGSNSSISSTVSGMSLSQSRTASSRTSTSSVDAQRKVPPPFDPSKLPILPPPNLREKAKPEIGNRPVNGRAPLLSVNSAPVLPVANGRPSLPSRDGPPRLPTRREEDEAPPPQPPRPTRSTEDTPPPQPPRPSRTASGTPPPSLPRRPPQPAGTARLLPPPAVSNNRGPNGHTPSPNPPKRAAGIQELDDQTFESAIMGGKPTFVKFYLTRCTNCHNFEPAWKQLAEDFAFASDKIAFAQLNADTYMRYNGTYKIRMAPTLLYFDGYSNTPERYQDGGIPELEPTARFIEEKIGVSRSDANNAPAINMSSKPSRAQVNAVQSRPAPPPVDTGGCLICRDFSAPDKVASEHPRESLPRGDKVSYLAEALCRPFRSPTDRARAIFRWLAFNIAYDTGAFFSNNVKHVEPADTIESGLAVCGGYAGLFVAIGRKAGLDCEMVTGHGKGIGYTPLQPGERPPPCKPDGHAWNAVRIDGGEWKLIEPCWGAGNVTTGSQDFNKVFTASHFTMSNDEFGLEHFPKDRKYFMREDGTTPTWDEYFIGPVGEEPVMQFGRVKHDGIAATSFSPPQKRIRLDEAEEYTRFQFCKICEHWDHERNGDGAPYCMVLNVNGVNGEKTEFVPFENDGYWWHLDIATNRLGRKGQNVSVMAVTTIDGKDARGITRAQYLDKQRRSPMQFGGVCRWDLI